MSSAQSDTLVVSRIEEEFSTRYELSPPQSRAHFIVEVLNRLSPNDPPAMVVEDKSTGKIFIVSNDGAAEEFD